MPEYNGPDRRAEDQVARKMAEDARGRADAAAKEVAVVGASLDAHLKSCDRSNAEVKSDLGALRRLLWGLIIAVIAGSGFLAVASKGVGL